MQSGVFRDGHPRIIVAISDEDVECILDTGFEGGLVLPPGTAARLLGSPRGMRRRRMADGREIPVQVYETFVGWHEDEGATEVLALGNQPLAGTDLFRDCTITIEVVDDGTVEVDR